MRLIHIGFALLLATAAYADIVTLKSGRVINGTYLGGSAREVRVEVGDQIETFDTSQVAKIEFGNGAASANTDRNRPVLRRSDSGDADEVRPSLRRDTTYGSSDPRPTVRRETSPSTSNDDGPPTLRRSASAGDAPQVLRPGDTGPGANSTAASVAAARGPLEISAGTNIVVRIIDAIDSEKAVTGQTYRASIDQPISVGDEIVIPRGADAMVKLVESKEAGKLTGRAELTIALQSVTVDGRSIAINTQNITQESDARGKRTATKAGGGAVLGAIIGGIAGGAGGAAAGAAAGGAAGAGVEAVSKGPKVKIPSETRLTFVLDNPVTI